jgi:hypothetical protein
MIINNWSRGVISSRDRLKTCYPKGCGGASPSGTTIGRDGGMRRTGVVPGGQLVTMQENPAPGHFYAGVAELANAMDEITYPKLGDVIL